MSWDISVSVPACESYGHAPSEIDIGNYTHNCNEMVRNAMRETDKLDALGERHLYALDGMTCRDVARLLVPAMKWWDEHRDEQAILNPENGWGDEMSAREYWWSVALACIEHPDGILRVDG